MGESGLPGLHDWVVESSYRPQEPPPAVALAGRDNRPGPWPRSQETIHIQMNALRPKVPARG
eukprot:8992225-Alexandrium_andersonii.AAC.1